MDTLVLSLVRLKVSSCVVEAKSPLAVGIEKRNLSITDKELGRKHS